MMCSETKHRAKISEFSKMRARKIRVKLERESESREILRAVNVIYAVS